MHSIEAHIPSCIEELQSSKNELGVLLITSTIRFPEDFPGFSGHFPEKPVLPAIVQLSSVRHLAESQLHKKLIPHAVQRTKFRAMIEPNQQVFFELAITPDEGRYQTRFKLRDNDRSVIADGTCTFTER